MKKKILCQAGHYNIKNNCDSYFRAMTGAPEEVRHNYEIALKFIDLLNKNGYEAHFTDANVNCPSNSSQVNKDWDLFLSLHCDANYTGDQGGGFVDYPDPSVDQASAESKRIKEAIEAEYFSYTGIRNVPSRSNPNTKFYYAWQYMTAKTPCVIIEMGESIDPHDIVILNDVQRVADGLLKGIKKAFPLQVVTPQPPQVVDCQKEKDEIKKLQLEIQSCKSKSKELEELLAEEKALRQNQKEQLIAKIIELIKNL